ncbi:MULTISPECIES: hypothetical protein [Gammaproteobacteria]|uniref:hypothetical protein n=1 Tax=Gammaproteobacteria TaxID=1236 RepID=UPI001ADD001A|nr:MULTISPECIES: hypothetical protein [Gammaproteobacteria]MBO9482495.1 hypothetical protein [Salinisphaera sp. G21_0]MBO9493100.1 hypothetical protein [Thalassotalea sp. G20_0]
MHPNSIRLLIAVPLLLSSLSLFAIADATPQASGITAEWTAPPPANSGMEPEQTPEFNENDQQQTVKKRTVDYRATTELLLERYPYALMSYFSEMDAILTSDDPEKQLFAIFRLSYLGSRHFLFVADPEAIPEQWQPHFTSTAEEKRKSGQTRHQIIGQVTIPDSNIRIRVFKLTEDPSSDAQTKSKIVLALAGEKSDEAVQCLVTQSKPAHPGSSPCSLAVKQLQDISDLADSLKDMYPNHSVEITGYSFSGAIAQAAMSISETIEQAYIFNSYGIHPSWLAGMPESRLARIHHSYVEGSFLHGQDYNPLSRYSRWKLPPNKVVVAGMKIPSSGLEPNIRHIYQLNHHDSWLDTFYNFVTSIWILHSKESVLRAFEANLRLDLPW